MAPFVEQALASTSQSDIAILSFALSLEALEAAFYANALKAGKLSAKAKKLATELGGHEQEHADTLSATVQALGGKPPAAAKYKFPGGGEAAFVKTGIALEEVGVGAYNGAAVNIQSPDLLGVAGAIVQVEARHAAALRALAGQDPAPNTFDKPLTPAQATPRPSSSPAAEPG